MTPDPLSDARLTPQGRLLSRPVSSPGVVSRPRVGASTRGRETVDGLAVSFDPGHGVHGAVPGPLVRVGRLSDVDTEGQSPLRIDVWPQNPSYGGRLPGRPDLPSPRRLISSPLGVYGDFQRECTVVGSPDPFSPEELRRAEDMGKARGTRPTSHLGELPLPVPPPTPTETT